MLDTHSSVFYYTERAHLLYTMHFSKLFNHYCQQNMAQRRRQNIFISCALVPVCP